MQPRLSAMEKGDFYSSTGVTLFRKQSSTEIDLTIEAEESVQYTTQFIGTRRDTMPHLTDHLGQRHKARVTHRYAEVGKLATVKGPRAQYALRAMRFTCTRKSFPQNLRKRHHAQRPGECLAAAGHPIKPTRWPEGGLPGPVNTETVQVGYCRYRFRLCWIRT